MKKKKIVSPLSKKSSMRLFFLERAKDASGVSGTGVVAEGVEFTTGMVALTWVGQHRCVNVYENIKTVEAIHGHEGMTKIVWEETDVND